MKIRKVGRTRMRKGGNGVEIKGGREVGDGQGKGNESKGRKGMVDYI